MSHRALIEIDLDLLEKAQFAPGTESLEETVDAALETVVRGHLRERLLARIVSGEGFDRSPELLAQSR